MHHLSTYLCLHDATYRSIDLRHRKNLVESGLPDLTRPHCPADFLTIRFPRKRERGLIRVLYPASSSLVVFSHIPDPDPALEEILPQAQRTQSRTLRSRSPFFSNPALAATPVSTRVSGPEPPSPWIPPRYWRRCGGFRVEDPAALAHAVDCG